MKTEIVPFVYEDHEMRVVCDEDGNPWFVAKEVCEILGLVDVSMTIDKLDPDEKLIQKLFVSGQDREVWTVSESGLYTLIFRSNKEEAKPFRRWVTHEVLPTIRQTGAYAVPGVGRVRVGDGLDGIARAAKELALMSKAFTASMSITRPFCTSMAEAVQMANELTYERTGQDCAAMLGVDFSAKRAGRSSRPTLSGPVFFEKIMDHVVGEDIEYSSVIDVPLDDEGRSVSRRVKDIVIDDDLYDRYNGVMADLGMKKALGGIFFHPQTVEVKLLRVLDGKKWRGCNV